MITNRIIELLNLCNVKIYRIHVIQTEAEERYYILHQEDIRRKRKTTEYIVTVYVEHKKDGKKMLGDATVKLFPGMNPDEMRKKISEAKKAAECVDVPYYEFTEPIHNHSEESSSDSSDKVNLLVNTIFGADCRKEVHLSYLEVFAEKKKHSIVSSYGQHICYFEEYFSGEFTACCKEPKDVEVYQEFKYREIDIKAIENLVKKSLELARERAQTREMLKSGTYDVILKEEFLYQILKMYLTKSNAENISAGYSDYKIGKSVSKKGKPLATLNLWLMPVNAFSDEGIPMGKRRLIGNGVLQNIHGNTKFSRGLNLNPIGTYEGIMCEEGLCTMESMKKKPYLMPVLFSDFIMYGTSGNFAGEIRLAYLFDGTTIKMVQGGSISGNLEELQDTMIFSKEMYHGFYYDGPEAAKLFGVQASGVEG